jgi:hypothetical protein
VVGVQRRDTSQKIVRERSSIDARLCKTLGQREIGSNSGEPRPSGEKSVEIPRLAAHGCVDSA